LRGHFSVQLLTTQSITIVFFTIFEWVKSPNEYFRDYALYILKRGINPLSYPRKPHWSLTWPQSPIYKKPAVSFMLNTLDPIYFSTLYTC